MATLWLALSRGASTSHNGGKPSTSHCSAEPPPPVRHDTVLDAGTCGGPSPEVCCTVPLTPPWPGAHGHSVPAKCRYLPPRPPRSTLPRAKRYSTRYSRVVTQRSTDLAQSSLPSVIGRERGYSGWYDRSMSPDRLLSVGWPPKAFVSEDPELLTLPRKGLDS